MSQPFDLAGRRILVTGAAAGIGRATCQRVASMGAHVLAVDRDEAGLAALLGQLPGTGHASRMMDLRELEEIPAAMIACAEEGGRLAGVVHAAGISSVAPTRLLAPRHYRDVLAINTEAALALVRGFQNRKVCEESGGSVVLIASVMALVGSVGGTAYSMSKAALMGLARSAALEYAPRGIRINCVAPGFVKTQMYEKVAASWDAVQREQIERAHPLGLGDPDDVANSVAFLLADASRWITGSTLVCDGGYTAS
ncbi:SDR family NAD(P)-dependent oxidoreductase [Herbaspirillum sp. CAH-3]|uniref:SDR family NAD(P)-dependent oxidoreductase n=1 Tax=Herbaspirillum sp. CAH-3 TaxID=2605746 RepID=UPI0012AD1667|nr:SDR family NAD(P)-dependent oxidoreductase [Herbaspirillum sp. CAH-3]MRT30642.1 SDR family oxidoreductase [Herbaspirillum sp. CAH-3]